MVIVDMTEQECRAMLAGTNTARLACAQNNQPYIVPIHVDLEGEFLYGYATLGQKIDWMRQNPLVCLEMDELTTDGRWASVVVFGRYEELPDTLEHEGSRSVAERLFQRRPVWWQPASVPLAGHEQRTPSVVRIQIGRRVCAVSRGNRNVQRHTEFTVYPRASTFRMLVGLQQHVNPNESEER